MSRAVACSALYSLCVLLAACARPDASPHAPHAQAKPPTEDSIAQASASASVQAPSAQASPAQREEPLEALAADETGTKVDARAHAVVCVALWIIDRSDTAERDAYGCALTPDELPSSDRPCRIREPHTTYDVTYDERGRLKLIRGVSDSERKYELAYDGSRLASIAMPAPYALKRRYEGATVDHDEIGGLLHRTRYTLVSGRAAKREYFILQVDSEASDTKPFTANFIRRGERVVRVDRAPDHPLYARWDSLGRPLRLEVEDEDEDAGSKSPKFRALGLIQYGKKGLPLRIGSAEVEYACGS